MMRTRSSGLAEPLSGGVTTHHGIMQHAWLFVMTCQTSQDRHHGLPGVLVALGSRRRRLPLNPFISHSRRLGAAAAAACVKASQLSFVLR